MRVSAKAGVIDTEKDKVIMDKKAYKELMNYIAKVDSRRLESDKANHIINLYAESHPVKLKPNSGQHKIKVSSSQSRNSEIQNL